MVALLVVVGLFRILADLVEWVDWVRWVCWVDWVEWRPIPLTFQSTELTQSTFLRLSLHIVFYTLYMAASEPFDLAAEFEIPLNLGII